jgi:ABC-type nitrate/sulfonate/bicarbonate transport system substrate-binding protein
MNRLARLARSLAAIMLVAATIATAATKVDVVMFPGGANWPLWVAQEKGFFAANGLDVSLTFTPSSVFLIENLHSGKFQIAHAAIDNLVAYQEGQGEAELAGPPDFVAFLGGQVGGIRLMVQPDVKSFADLKGKAIGVDAPTTGFAFVLRKMLQRGGLAESDYTFERLGNTAARTQALMDGRTIGTIVTSPLDLAPESKGFRRLADGESTVGPYQAIAGITRRSWARDNEAAVVGYVRAYVAAMDWLADSANREEAIAIYRRNLPALNEAAARKHWDALLAGGREGLERKGRVDMAGLETVLKLRSEFGRPQKSLTDPSKYVDESYYRKAAR